MGLQEAEDQVEFWAITVHSVLQSTCNNFFLPGGRKKKGFQCDATQNQPQAVYLRRYIKNGSFITKYPTKYAPAVPADSVFNGYSNKQ